MLQIVLGLLIVVSTAYMIVKKFNPQATLIFAGLLMLVISLFIADAPLLDEETTTGAAWLDLFELMKNLFAKTLSGVGLVIMAVGGFALYMSKIGASGALVRLVIKPLKAINRPYLVLALAFVVGQLLAIVIPSASGLAMLLMVTMFPLLISVGISRLSAAAIIATTACQDLGPASSNTNLAAEMSGVSVQDYFLTYQGPVALVVIVVVAVTHYFVQRYFDQKADTLPGSEIPVPVGSSLETVAAAERKAAEIKERRRQGLPVEDAGEIDILTLTGEDAAEDDQVASAREELTKAPLFYAFLPLLPLVLILTFSEFVIAGIDMDVATAMILSVLITIVIEIVRHRSIATGFSTMKVFFEGMGRQLTNVVSLIIAGQIFAEGLFQLGTIDVLIESAQEAQFGSIGMVLVLGTVIIVSAVVMGSSNAPWFAFAPIIPEVSGPLGVPATQIAVPLELSGGFGRSMSPIAGVVIAVAGLAGVSPVDVVKRTIPVMLVGWITMLVASFIIL